jgi:hypothetical protein
VKLWQKIVTFLLMTSLSACVTPIQGGYGVQADQLAHIPARIAVTSCRVWPQGALYPSQKALQLAAEDLSRLCQRYDRAVLDGFEGQPYMRGLSPRVVQALLEKNQQGSLLAQLEQLWFRPGQVCAACQHPSSYYREVIAPRNDWRQWLSQLSRSASNSDALLLPLVLEGESRVIDDRGLFYASRSASLALLLIDTNNGQLIWIGGRTAQVRRALPGSQKEATPEQFPTWDELWTRLFTSDLWQEFPGRQNS